jgi:hypothetical protein
VDCYALYEDQILTCAPAECIYQRRWVQPPREPTSETSSLKSTSNSLAPTNGGGFQPVKRSKKAKESDDAKLIFGVAFSLRNMVRRLGGDDDEYAIRKEIDGGRGD